MRLKRLKLFGFKSFADNSVIEFIDGITAIVGPNGCGKSNVADAFRWVLGEQSAKSLRGGRMPDIIFAGTSKRKPVNYAEVSLTLTDVQGALPVDYDEVTVTRRCHRSGESEYFINRHPVRLKEIHGLFLDSGIGRSAFSIFEQGKIDQVINLSPYERRSLFEEAAGILRFLQRKREALRKLEEVERNMSRLQDVSGEVSKRVDLLAEQAEAARGYKALKAEYDSLHLALLWTRYAQQRVAAAEAKSEEKELLEQAEVLQQSVIKKQSQLQQARHQLSQHHQRLATQREEMAKVEAVIEHGTRDRRKNRELMQEAQAVQKRCERELSELETGRLARKQESVAGEHRLGEVVSLLKEVTAHLDTAKARATQVDESLGTLRQQHEEVQKQRLAHVELEAKLRSEVTSHQARLENAEVGYARAQKAHETLKTSAESLIQQVSTHEQALEHCVLEGEKRRLTIQRDQETLSKHKESLEKARRDLAVMDRELTQIQARRDVLVRLKKEGEGLSKGTQAVLKASKKVGSSLHELVQPLYELLDVDHPSIAPALGTALRPYAQAIVVHTLVSLDAVLQYCKNHRLKGVTIVCCEALQVAHSELTEHFARCLEQYDSLENAFQLPYGSARFSHDWVIDAFGVLTVVDGEGSNAFSREHELKGLEKDLAVKKSAHEQAHQAVQEGQDTFSALAQSCQESEKAYRALELKRLEAKHLLDQGCRERDRILKQCQVSQDEAQALQKEIAERRARLDDILSKVRDREAESSAEKEHSKIVEQRLKECVDEQRLSHAELKEAEKAFHQCKEEQRTLSHTLSLIAVKDHETQAQETRLRHDFDRARKQQRGLELELTEHVEGLDAAEVRRTRLQEARRVTEEEISQAQKGLHAQQKTIDEEGAKKNRLDDRRRDLGVKQAELRAGAEGLGVELMERYEFDVNDPPAKPKLELSQTQTEKRLRLLRRQLEENATINMTSIEDHQSEQQRLEQLEEQLKDLGASREELLRIITELDGESRQRFKDTFDVIRVKFREIFALLFRGGEADLKLTESQDILDAGIEIVAKPPGKQMRSIQLMSGGEKCLTALALLFALFEVKPAPFCILDEIDAPLDDSNVDRFVDMIKHFRDRCQFIVITHNKGTMSAADVLVGVSMQEKGVSKVLSLDFSRREMAIATES